MRLGSRLAIILLSLVCLSHLLRFVFGVELVANGTEIPLWVSVLGCLIPGTIAVMLWQEAR